MESHVISSDLMYIQLITIAYRVSLTVHYISLDDRKVTIKILVESFAKIKRPVQFASIPNSQAGQVR